MYDTIIIGAGPAGMTAALYAARSNLKVALIEGGLPGGQMNNTSDIENYPGYANISGPELAEKMFEELNSRGVSYCAVCDGAFFRDQDLLVVGGGDSAVEEALFLTRFAKTVTIVHRRDQLRAQKVLQDRAFANEKISFIWDSVVKEIKGENRVESVVFENVKTGQVTEQAFGGVFIYVGLDPLSDFVKELNIQDQAGWIVTDNHMKTAVDGIFAVGDVRLKDLRQVTTAVGDGAIAGQEAYKFITEHS